MHHKSTPALRKVAGVAEVERAAAVETGKPEEAVARARCWKGSLMKGLKRTGEPFICFSWGYIIYAANPNVTFLLLQRL